MAYNVDIHGSNQYSRSVNPVGIRSNPTFAMATNDPGNPVPNTRPSKAESRTKASMPAIGADLKAKRDVMSKKLAYALGFDLGKAAAYPLQTFTAPAGTAPNILPPLASTERAVESPKQVWPSSTAKDLNKPTATVAPPKIKA